MSPEALFAVTFPVVVPFWALMILAPWWSWTAGLQALLGSPVGAAAVWAYLITFDLFVGRWMFLDARRHRMPALVESPVLFFTILVSPVGLAAHLVLRHLLGREPAPDIAASPAVAQPVVG